MHYDTQNLITTDRYGSVVHRTRPTPQERLEDLLFGPELRVDVTVIDARGVVTEGEASWKGHLRPMAASRIEELLA